MQLKISSRLVDMTMRPWMPFSRSVSEDLGRIGWGLRDGMDLAEPWAVGGRALAGSPFTRPSLQATEPLSILQDGLQELVVSLDLL